MVQVQVRLTNCFRQYAKLLLKSLDMKTTDEYIKLYKIWLPLILNDGKLWKLASKVSSREKVKENKENLKKIKSVINRLEYFQNIDLGDKKINESEAAKAKRELNNLLEKFLEFFIKCKLDKDYPSQECLKLIEIFFPLHLLQKKSGILMLTYKKFETKIPYFIHNGEKWVKKSKYLDQYAVKKTNDSNKFIFAFDEQEDGYQIILKEKIDIVSPQEMAINNALSSINREFSLLFSKRNSENRSLLSFLDKNKGAYDEYQEHFEKEKKLSPKLQEYVRRYQVLTSEEGNSVNFLQKVISINKGLEVSLEEIVNIFNSDEKENPVVLNFGMLSRVFRKFENNRSLLIPQKLYNRISDDLMSIFSYNNLYVYNIEPLKKLFLTKSSGGHVHIAEKKVSDKTSVAELIYAILAMRSQIKNIKDILTNVLDAEDSQSRSLDVWSQQINKLQKAKEEGVTQDKLIKYLNRVYVYESNKSIINIKEISRYQSPKNNLIDPALREVSIGSTAIFTSPEHKITSILKDNANVVFLISATGGIRGDLSTSYDMGYLEDSLRHESGQSSFKAMVEEEVSLCEEIRNYRQENRQITVDFFNQDLLSFPNCQTQKVVERFETLILRKFIENLKHNVTWFSSYKIEELRRFVRFLFYLFEDDSIKETIAFTQTLRWIRELIEHCQLSKNTNFAFEKSSEHPNIYYVAVNHKSYSSDVRIKVILYEASFNRRYYAKDTQKEYSDELVEEEGQKIFFISAYQSASKGLNPIIRKKDEDGTEKDFDSLVLLMDSYYTVINSQFNKSKDFNKLQDSEKGTTLYHFALMKSIVSLGDSSLEIKDFNKYLSKPEATKFREQQHQILLGKGILQAIGRAERRDFSGQVIKIFVNEETRKNLVNLYNYLEREEPKEICKLSVNNYKVYLRVREEQKKRSIDNYDDHIYDEIDADSDFQQFRVVMLEEIKLFHQKQNNFDITKAWEALRDLIVFQNPAKYLEKLRKSKLFPDDFIESLFYHPEQSEFTPYLASVEEDGKRLQVISDSIHGEKIYAYQKRLYPEYLKTNSQGYDLEGNEIGLSDASTNSIYRLYNKLIPQPEIFNNYIPRYNFFYDVLYPSLAENFVERWIKDIIFQGRDSKDIKASYGFEQLNFEKYNKLYEKFDLYYMKNKTLFCIDVKAWSKPSGNRLSNETLKKAKSKLKSIASDYPEFSTVKGLLLNLHAHQEKSQQHSSILFSGNLIYFDSRRCPVESTVLRDFMFSKNK